MSHPDQLRQYARDCLRLSQDMTSPELRIHLINMAEAWAGLATQSERIAALCTTIPIETVASAPLVPNSERPGGTHRGPEPSRDRSPEHSAAGQAPANDGGDEQDR
jgi:hypothetical protein